MILSNPDQWTALWRKQPGRLPSPFAEPIISERDALQIVIAASGDSRTRLFRRGTEQVTDPASLPTYSDDSFRDYFCRLKQTDQETNWSIALSAPERWSSVLYRRTLEFLEAIYRTVGDYSHLVYNDLFALTGTKGFFGLHKDEQDVFTVVLMGHRRFLLWPYEALRARLRLTEKERLLAAAPVGASLDSVPPPSIVLDAWPGDVIYWPADWWHLGQGDGECAVTFGFGLRRDAHPLRHVNRALRQFQEAGSIGNLVLQPRETDWSHVATDYHTFIDRLVHDKSVKHAISAEVLRAITMCGMRESPPPAPTLTMEDSTLVRQVTATSIVPVLQSDRQQIEVHVAGAVVSLEKRQEFYALLSALKDGREHSAGSLIQQAIAGSETRNDAGARLRLLTLLETLEQYHGLERIPARGAGVSE